MKSVLVLGAGLVSRPLVRYLLDQPGVSVTVATRTVSKAEVLIERHPQGKAESLDVNNETELELKIKSHDLTVSLLPYVYHPKVASLCVKHRKNMVTTSYVSEMMKALDRAAKNAGVLLLNETGVDPGIDHMLAIKTIDAVHARGGRVTGFLSFAGGLPAPDANDNPLGYKFSWSPRGVLLAGKNDARFLQQDRPVEVPGWNLFENKTKLEICGLGIFEQYPNRDSLPYRELYHIPEAETMYRGTIRYPGWCDTMLALMRLGFFDEKEQEIDEKTFAEFSAELIGCSGPDMLMLCMPDFLGKKKEMQEIENIKWIGLLSNEKIPFKKGSPLDVLVEAMQRRMQYGKNERDMLILMHEFYVKYENRSEKITALMVDYGIPGGDTSMSRTVSLPAAICARLILENKISTRGVRIPVEREIYEPVLRELNKMGIKFSETTEPFQKEPVIMKS